MYRSNTCIYIFHKELFEEKLLQNLKEQTGLTKS